MKLIKDMAKQIREHFELKLKEYDVEKKIDIHWIEQELRKIIHSIGLTYDYTIHNELTERREKIIGLKKILEDAMYRNGKADEKMINTMKEYSTNIESLTEKIDIINSNKLFK